MCWRIVKSVPLGKPVRREKRGKAGMSVALVHRERKVKRERSMASKRCTVKELPSGWTRCRYGYVVSRNLVVLD